MVSASWKNEPLGRVATLQRGFDLPSRLRKPGEVPIITSSGIEDKHCEAKVKGPGVVTGRYGTIGEVFFVRDDFWPLNTTLYVRDFHGNDPLFISYLLRTIDFHTHSGKSGVPRVNRNDLHEIVVPLPSTTAEQEAIAEALSDADALIESLEQLLVKKRQLKQGAMQELLTGKKRLPGFSGEWASARLRDLLTYERPDRYIVRDTEYGERGHIPVLTANKAFILGYTDEDFGICQDVPVIIFDDFTTDSKYVGFPFKVKSSAIKLLRARSHRVNLRYVFERMRLMEFPLGDHKRYYISEYQNLLLAAPDSDEQTAIASALADMDVEIAVLEARRDKAKQIKQGMMQELLTGRIRLV